MTNPVLGAFVNNTNNTNTTANTNPSTLPNTNQGPPGGNNNNNNNNQAQEDISPEGLLQVISQEWGNEMERIRGLGLNGYKRRKESRSECLV